MNTFFGNATSLRQAELSQLFAYRHAVFVEKLKWDLPNARDGLEMDEFDRPDTIHVLASGVEGKLCGCARLLPTTKPYLLGSVFPELMNSVAPHSSEVWEISRFTSIALDHDVTLRRRQADAWGCREVMAATVAAAMGVGAQRLIGVSVLSIERILLRLGVNAHRAGPPMDIRGHRIFAFWLEIDNQTLSALGLDRSSWQPAIYDRFKNVEKMTYSGRHVET